MIAYSKEHYDLYYKHDEEIETKTGTVCTRYFAWIELNRAVFNSNNVAMFQTGYEKSLHVNGYMIF